MHIKSILISAVIATCSGGAALAQQEPWKGDYQEEQLPFGYVRSMDALHGGGGEVQALQLMVQAEYENHNGHPEKAAFLCQKALQVDPNDIDVHKAYAESLEKVLKRQKEKDPVLFMTTVKEWLIVMRSEVGDEKGLSSPNGLSLPGMQHMYQDEERGIPAQQHLVHLVGYLPRPFETDRKYLIRVAKATQAIVNGRIMKSKNSTPAAPSGSRSQLDSAPEVKTSEKTTKSSSNM
jgi:hypothetical protein